MRLEIISILVRSSTFFLLMVLITSACIVAREALSRAKLSTDIIRWSYDKSGLRGTVKSNCGGGNGGADDEEETAISWSAFSRTPNSKVKSKQNKRCYSIHNISYVVRKINA